MVVERFAPSPTGLLHLGHAYSADVARTSAKQAGGRFLLRLEDLDTSRVREAYVDAILEDLHWLGLDWDGPVLRQSTRAMAYRDALQKLSNTGLVYACACTRRDIAEAASAPQEGAHYGPDGLVYPGTCRSKGLETVPNRALRLDMARAVNALGGVSAASTLLIEEIGEGPNGESGAVPLDPAWLIDGVGDVVLARRDGAVAYHLAVVVDDAHQGVTHVTRGQDLFEATAIHRLLQALLNLKPPVWRHHPLVRDAAGKRLAKRDDARAIARFRTDGMTAPEVLERARLSARSGP